MVESRWPMPVALGHHQEKFDFAFRQVLAGPQLLAAKSPGGSDAARYTVLGARV
jgi:hypothetical protein